MAYQRKGRHTSLPEHVQKPPALLQSTADLPSRVQYDEAAGAPPGAVSVVGRPVSVFDTLPAGTLPFRLNFPYQLPQDVEPSEPLTIAEWKAPVGRVMVVTSWEVRLVPSTGVGNDQAPYYAARIMNTRPIVASMARNKQKQLGATDVNFWPFDGEADTHVIYYADQVGSVVANIASPLLWQDEFQNLEVVLNGLYLLPNHQAPEYTELEIGVVRSIGR